MLVHYTFLLHASYKVVNKFHLLSLLDLLILEHLVKVIKLHCMLGASRDLTDEVINQLVVSHQLVLVIVECIVVIEAIEDSLLVQVEVINHLIEILPESFPMVEVPLVDGLPLTLAVLPCFDLEAQIGILLLGDLDIQDTREVVIFIGPLLVLSVQEGEIKSDVVQLLIADALVLRLELG